MEQKARPRSLAARRLAGIGTSIFSEMTALASSHGAANLGQGFPDFPAPAFVKDAARRAIAADHNQYAPAAGIPALRQAIAERYRERDGLAFDPDQEITVTGGATEAIFDTVLALVDPGDEVIVFEPSYDSYVPAIQAAGGVPRPVRLEPPTFALPVAALEQAIGPRTKLVIVNTPHNPTGKILSKDELAAVGALCARHDLLVLSDEVYSEITFAPARHQPPATVPELRARTVTIDSFGKTFSVTGWKIGWAAAAPALTQAIRGIHQFSTFCNATPLQVAAAEAIAVARKTGYYQTLREEYADRRRRLEDTLAAAGLSVFPIDGAYFLLADIDHLPYPDDVAFCRALTTQAKVAAIPPSAFYLDPKSASARGKLARFCFAKSDTTLALAAERLQRFFAHSAVS